MLGKLFKYEFKHTAKLMLTIYAVMAAVTALGMTVLSINSLRNGAGMTGAAFVTLYMILYILSAFALMIVTYVYVVLHFYKSMYSAQGYLTHTLPVHPVMTFSVKVVTGLVWMLLSILLLVLSIFGIAGAASGPDFWDLLKSIDFAVINAELLQVAGVSLPGFFGLIAVLALFTCLNTLLMFYTSCSVGQLFSQYKVVASIVAGIVFYFAQQMVNLLSLFITLALSSDKIESVFLSSSAVNTSIRISEHVWTALAPILFFIVVYCLLNVFILRKHINLE